jgi:nucleotide-binding universal stress UspA family protein
MPGLTALIPLDGTKLSESSFEMLPFIKGLGFTKVQLISVWDGAGHDEDKPDSQMSEVIEKGRAYLQAYLDVEAEGVRAAGFEVETLVRIGHAATETLDAAAANASDLIIIASHGRDGLARWRLGSVADKIIRHATCPTLVIGPNVEVELAPYSLERILVPLDGSALAEEALPIASYVATAQGAALDLVRVVSVAPVAYDTSMGGYPVDLMSAMEDAAATYLGRIAAKLESKHKVETSLLIGAAGEQLLEYLQEKPAGLVVMASHGRSGFARAALGSVADRMLHGPAPVLILRPEEEIKSRMVADAEASASVP